MRLLTNTIQHYPWGSRDHIAALQGRPQPSAQPEAELWMGTHERGSSLVDDAPLREHVTLPYLLKYLAAAQPLSIQVHPNAAQAAAGYLAENNANIPLDAHHRSYRDPNHKPELLCALTDFHALAGFKDLDDIKLLLAETPPLSRFAPLLDQGLRSLVTELLRTTDAAELVAATVAAVGETDPLALVLHQHFPGDIGVIVGLLLNEVHLRPGQAIFVPAGMPHAYVSGVGVEIMANSDNVLRCGLTEKHIDIDELLSVTAWDASGPEIYSGDGVANGVRHYRTPAREFGLWQAIITEDTNLAVPDHRIVFCLSGQVTAADADGTVTLTQGSSSYSRTGMLRLAGAGTVFVAAPPA